MSAPSATADIRRELDPRIWRACAGASVQIPSLYSRVYYFPQGHVEHCCASSVISSLSSCASIVPCVISGIELLADPITDEVFAHLLLQPVALEHCMQSNLSRFGRYESDEEENKVTTFAKILTPSDANSGGGFSIPRYCAVSILPPLDHPAQNLLFTDCHGVEWEFRHTYRGAPKRHLFTSGWTKFVNNKKLIAGDSVVLMRKSAKELFIGVRRAPISSNGGTSGTSFYGEDAFSSYQQSSGGDAKEDEEAPDTFRRTGKGKLTAKSVTEAINRASQGLAFEVVYYPSAGWSDFVVRAEDVEASMAIVWNPGTRVKMAKETDDSSRITWFQGIVSSTFQETSPWKKLEVTWDEPEILKNMKRVSPWQVEVVGSPSQYHATFSPTNSLMVPQSTGFLSREGQSSVTPVGNPSPYLLSYTTSPAGMQGARHCEIGSLNPTNLIGENPPQLCTNNFFSPLPVLGKISTEMYLGSPPSEELSPNSNITNQSTGNEPLVNREPISAKGNSFQLFGQTINVQGNSKRGLAVNGSKKSSDTEESRG